MIKILQNKSKLKFSVTSLLVIGIVLMFVAYVFSMFFTPVDIDASYYLGAVEQIYNGKVPYRDFVLSYTPLSFYVYVLVRWISGLVNNYTLYIAVLYCLTVVNSFVLYKITKKLTGNLNLSLLAAFLFLLFSYNLQGLLCILEPFVLFWGLLSIYVLIAGSFKTKHLILSGIYAAFAFLSKQYGLGFLGVCMLIVLVNYSTFKSFLRNELIVISSFSLVIVSLACLALLVGVRADNIFSTSTGGTYGVRSTLLYWDSLKFLIFYVCPFLLIIPLYLFYNFNSRSLKLSLVFLLAITIFSFQFFFQNLVHYYLLILPFAILVAMLVLSDNCTTTTRYLLIFLLILPSVRYSVRTIKNTYNLIESKPRAIQQQVANEISTLIGDVHKKKIYCYGGEASPYYFINKYTPPLINKYGYGFGFETVIEVLDRLYYSNAFIISVNDYDLLMQKSNGWRRVLKVIESDFKQINTTTDMLVFVRK